MPTTTTTRSEQIAALYAAEAHALEDTVRGRAARASTATIEDACAYAWERLLRRPDVELTPRWRVRGWLTITATRQAWQLLADRQVPTEALTSTPDTDALHATAADPAELALTRMEHDQRAQDLRQLKPREARDLALLAAGYSYDEIAALTGTSHTAVNRRLTEGRAHLRRLAEQRTHTTP